MNGRSTNNGARTLDLATSLANEFAAVTVSIDHSGRGPRLFISDDESGEGVYLDPLQLAALCRSTPLERQAWLRTGDYTDTPIDHASAHTHGSHS